MKKTKRQREPFEQEQHVNKYKVNRMSGDGDERLWGSNGD